MPPVSVLIKRASSMCNLRCEYCFYDAVAENRSTANYGFMKRDVIKTIISKVLDFADDTATFSFQGGEPTLCGLDFFREVVSLQRSYNKKNVNIMNCLQTNGILIDEKWASFLSENRFLVGLSLDGPEKYHNAFRLDPVGNGTFQNVMKTARLLEEYGVDYNILFVVNSVNARRPERLYDFFKNSGFHFLQFIPCIDPEGHPRGKFPFSLASDKFALFLNGFFDKWYADIMSGYDISIRYFDNLVRMAMGLRPETCSMQGSCSCQFVFEANGNVYPCDFYVTDDWCMGNILSDELLELYSSPAAQHFIKTSLPVADKCTKCKWYSICRGGCRRDRMESVTGNIELNSYCEAYSDFFEYAYDRIINLGKYIISKKSR